MLDHKRDYCKLRFTCKCDVLNEECTTCDLSTSELMNINCNQASQGDTNSADASINTSTSNNVPNDASISTALSNSSGTGNFFKNFNFYIHSARALSNNNEKLIITFLLLNIIFVTKVLGYYFNASSFSI